MPQYLSPGVYVEEIDSGARPIEGVGTAVAAFIGLAEKGPFNQPILCSNWTQFTKTFGGFIEGASLARSVFGFFQNGGGNSYIVRIGDGAGENGHGSHQQPAIEAAPQGVLANLRVVALDPAAPRDSIKVEIVEFQHEGQDGQEGARALKLVVERDGHTVEEHHDITAGRGKTNVVTVVNAASQVIRLEQIAGKGLEELHSGMRVALAAPSEMAVATPPARLSADDYVGDVADRTGFAGLEAIDEVTMVCVPDLMAAYQQGAIDLETVQGRAAGDDRPLRADGRPRRDPRPAARPERPADQGVAGRQGRLRLEVRHPVLAVDQGHRPGDGQRHASSRRRATSPASGPATTTPAACTRPRPTRSCAARSRSRRTSPRASTTCSTRSASTASGRSRAGASASGARARCRQRPGMALPQRPPAVQLRRGVDPARHQLGGVRAQRPRAVGQVRRTITRSWSRVAQGRPVRADARRGVLRQVRRGDQPARGHRRRAAGLRDRRRAGQAGRVRRLPALSVLRRHQPRRE